jgi:two-component system chemotaxis response regulator CheB
VVVIGGSAGAIEPLKILVRQLPEAFPAAVAVVIHGVSAGNSLLPAILRRVGALEAGVPHDEEALFPARIYIATTGRHLIVDDGMLRLVRAAEENRVRPAIDPLFRSAAQSHGRRAIGVILSGTLDDGSAGLFAIREAGGHALVQDPREALFSEMPTNAIRYARPDAVLPILELAREVNRLAMAEEGDSSRRTRRSEGTIGAEKVSELTCPLCHGALWEREVGDLVQYRCRTGHVFGQDTLASEQDGMIEDALWAGVRALEERGEFSRRLAARFDARGDTATSARYVRQALAAERRAKTLRETVLGDDAEV